MMGSAPIAKRIKARVSRIGTPVNKVPAERIPRINKVENGKEQARISMANSVSKVLFDDLISWASSFKLKADICANGQKLQELKGKTTASIMAPGTDKPRAKIMIALIKIEMPARQHRIDMTVPKPFLLSFTAKPINIKTNGVIIALSRTKVSDKKLGSVVKLRPKLSSPIAKRIMMLIGSLIKEINKLLSFD